MPPTKGTWGTQLCFLFEAKRAECGLLTVRGKTGSFGEKSDAVAFKIIPGDAIEQFGVKPVPPPVGGPRLVDLEAANAIVGNTLVGTIEDKGETVVYLDKNGAVRISQGGKSSSGTWSITGTTMCTDVENHKDCFMIEAAGNQVTWTLTTGAKTKLNFTLLPGNARNL
jgi:hypothetical protein